MKPTESAQLPYEWTRWDKSNEYFKLDLRNVPKSEQKSRYWLLMTLQLLNEWTFMKADFS